MAVGIDMFAFTTNPRLAADLVRAGAGVVIDWEQRAKRERQAGWDTQVNADTPRDLARVRAATPGRILVRVDGGPALSRAQIEHAIALGADEILLPMVRTPGEVDAALEAAGGRRPVGILVETADAVAGLDALLDRPIARVYVGLNDLMIDRGSRCLFLPLVDGTVEHVARAAAARGVPLGVAGLTVPEGGAPVPSRLLAAELARIGAAFTFLRRSFHADTAGRDAGAAVRRIATAYRALAQRSAAEIAADRRELEAVVHALTVAEVA